MNNQSQNQGGQNQNQNKGSDNDQARQGGQGPQRQGGQGQQGNDRGSSSRSDDSNNRSTSGGSQGGQGERGFAAMDPEEQRQIAAKGGRAAQESGNAHEFTRDEASEDGSSSADARSDQGSIDRSGGGESR